MYRIRGRVTKVNQSKKIKLKNQDKDFEFMTFNLEETETGFKHPYQFQLNGTNSINEHILSIKEDKFVNIEFYIKSRVWEGKYYYNLIVKHLTESSLKEDEDYLPFSN